MAFRKNNRQRIIAGAGFLVLLLLVSCKKLKTKDPIVFNISAMVPYDSTPVPGISYRIVEYKTKGAFLGIGAYKQEATGWELDGVTGSDGKVSGSFTGVLKSNYSYTIYFDYSGAVLPAGFTDVIVKGPQYDLLSRGNPDENNYKVRVLPYMQINFKVENINCQGATDSMRIILRNIDEYSYVDLDYENWSPYFSGCYSYTNANTGLAGRNAYKIQVIRGGNLIEYYDTILIAPGINNNLFIEY